MKARALYARGVRGLRRRLGSARRRLRDGLVPAAERWMLDEADQILAARPEGNVAVLVGPATSRFTDVLRSRRPRARVVTIQTDLVTSSMHAELAAGGPYRVIVVTESAVATTAELGALYKAVLFHLAPGGLLLFSEMVAGQPARSALWPLLLRLTSLGQAVGRPRAGTDADERALAAATVQVRVAGRRLAVTNGVAALAKMGEAETDQVLARRGRKAGGVLERYDAETFGSRGVVRDYREHVTERSLPPIEVPALSLREYHGAVLVPRQITVLDNLLLTDSYRHPLWPRLVVRGTTEVAPLFATVDADLSAATPVDGALYQLDSEWNGHYGHLITEQIARLWGWRAAQARDPGLRAALYTSRPEHKISRAHTAVLAAFGITDENILVFSAPVRPEHVVAATPMFSQPNYVSPRITETWDEVGRAAAAAGPTPSRIFVSRRGKARAVHNRDQLELVFAGAGFAILYPEDLPFGEQVALFRNADVIAGFAGSGMFTMAFCDAAKPVILICSEDYIPENELLISAVRGHVLNILWSRPDSHEVNAPFTFDFDREGRHLERLLGDLPATSSDAPAPMPRP